MRKILFTAIALTILVGIIMTGLHTSHSDCAIYYYNGEVTAIMARDFCEEDEGLTVQGCMLGISDPKAVVFYNNYVQYHQGTCGRINDDGYGAIIDNDNKCKSGVVFVPVYKTETGTNGYITCNEDN